MGGNKRPAPGVVVAQGARVVDLDGPLLLAEDREHGLRYDDGDGGAAGLFDVDGDIEVTATNEGFVAAAAVAGSKVSKAKNASTMGLDGDLCE